ncbi:hypothetical protein [Sphingopyxis lindanitolerans]|uniref:hypothetical protein n=1 Tax=Sphingopyxis lindanitolerans TaxID=2054227 RepID=UPI001F5BAFEE|nr:hypothetical protein [Sphingopyxis lindanitolerans]
MQQITLGAENPNLIGSYFNPLGKRANMVAAIAAFLISHPLARGAGELRQHVRRDRLPALCAEQGRHALGVGLCLIARRLERRDALLEIRVVHVGNPVLDCIIEPLQPQLRLRGSLVEFGDMGTLARRLFLPPIQNGRQDGFQSLGP